MGLEAGTNVESDSLVFTYLLSSVSVTSTASDDSISPKIEPKRFRKVYTRSSVAAEPVPIKVSIAAISAVANADLTMTCNFFAEVYTLNTR